MTSCGGAAMAVPMAVVGAVIVNELRTEKVKKREEIIL
jgi:hypothetical protein